MHNNNLFRRSTAVSVVIVILSTLCEKVDSFGVITTNQYQLFYGRSSQPICPYRTSIRNGKRQLRPTIRCLASSNPKINGDAEGLINGGVNGGKNGSEIRVMTWNILADALATDEFVTLGGDDGNVAWFNNRDVKIGKMLIDSFAISKMAVVATHENDHPQWLLAEIRKVLPSVKMCILSTNTKNKSATKYERCYIRRLSNTIAMMDAENDYVCPVQCNGNDPGCSKTAAASKDCLQKHYETCNEWFLQNSSKQRLEELCQQGVTCTSNSQEQMMTTDDNDGNDLYLPSAAGTVIYYDSDQVTLLQHYVRRHRVDFVINNKDRTPFTVFAAHLKSGINLKAERKRSRELDKLLSQAKSTPNPIMLLDANSCEQYQQDLRLLSSSEEKEEWTTDTIGKYDFINLVPLKGNECLKLRTYATYQPQKAGQFMFDTLDQILVPSSVVKEGSKYYPITSDTYYPSEYYNDYLKLRNTPALRNALKQMCLDQKWESDLRPFLPNMNKAFAKYISQFKEEDCDDVILEHDISSLLSHLYPNKNTLPSDHPPVCASIILQPQPNGKSDVINGQSEPIQSNITETPKTSTMTSTSPVNKS